MQAALTTQLILTSAVFRARTRLILMPREGQYSKSRSRRYGNEFAGLNIEEPQNFGVLNANHECGVTVTCNGYDLRGATAVQFDVRSPTGINVQFAVGGCKTPSFVTLPPSQTYTHWSLALNTTSLTCTPDLTSVNLYAVIASNEPNGASILIDNIQFTPAPARMSQGAETFDLPLSTKTFGVVPQISSVPPDQVNRNVAAIYECSADSTFITA